MTNDDVGFSHLDERGEARMVDVGGKKPTLRRAVASCRLRMRPETIAEIRGGKVKKGDVLSVATIAGIQGAKQTSTLIPLCHPLPVEKIAVDFSFDGEDTLVIRSEVSVTAKTGVEMEALTAVSVAALTVYDMCKSADRAITIECLQLDEKEGGKSGHYRREGAK